MQSDARGSFLSSQTRYRRHAKKEMMGFLVSEFNMHTLMAQVFIDINQCWDKKQMMNMFILNDQGRYPHVFMPDNPAPDQASCRICAEGPVVHQNSMSYSDLSEAIHNLQAQLLAEEEHTVHLSDNYSSSEEETPVMRQESRQRSIFRQEILSKEVPEEQECPYNCCICCNMFPYEEMVWFGDQVHDICLDCMNSSLNEKIINMQVEDLACPHCSKKLTQEVIQEYVSQPVFLKYQAFMKNVMIKKNPNLKWCPNPKCSVVISTNKSRSVISCPKCDTKLCLKCNQEAHPKLSCNQAIRNIYKGLEGADDIQKCKKCKALVQKVAGCNHMTCRNCKYEWCWLCGSTYSDIHFSPLNPLGCAGMQNRNITTFSKCKIYILRVLMILGFLVLAPIVIPIVLLFCGPVLIFNLFKRNVCRYSGCFTSFLVALLSLPLGIIADPFVWIGGLIYFAPVLCESIAEWFERRRNINQESENSIKRKLLEEGEAVVVSED